MKVVRTSILGLTLASALVSAGCASTLFFPAKPAEKAADALIDEIWPDVAKPSATPGIGNDGAKEAKKS
ncbi:MAG: hypothetical protein ABL931_14740 [Usitatibacteraceae bacterium]